MNALRIIIQEELIDDFLSGKASILGVDTWPTSYKRFIETTQEGELILNADGLCKPKVFNIMNIRSTNGKYYQAHIVKTDVSKSLVRTLDKDGKDVLDDKGNAAMQPSVLLYKGSEWPQFKIEYTLANVEESSPWESPTKKNVPSIIKENWDDYKEGRRGSEAIKKFQVGATPNVTLDEQLALIKEFDPNYMENLGEKDIKWVTDNIDLFYDDVSRNTTYSDLPTNINEAADFYEGYMSMVDPSYRDSLNFNLFITLDLYAWCQEYFFPNLYVMNFIALQRFFDKFNLDLPEVPSRTNWEKRCMYYMELCKIVYQFRIDNGLTPAELSALMFDYSQRHIEEPETSLPEASQAWLIGGTSGDAEKDAEYRFWQANPDTKRGDILIHYEKYPTKAITAVWRAEENGIVDPFFAYYSNTYAGHRINVPHITLDELKNDDFFKNPDSPVGKLINKNFQGVNGWTVSGEDYKHFLDIWKRKGFDVSKLPSLYAPELPNSITIEHESDASNKLLRPMLNSMGWKEGEDFKPEVHFKAGRGSAKRPDFCLHIKGEGEDVEARVIFECKLYMKNSKEIEANFTQGRSYAKWGNAKVLVLCDKMQILVYDRHNGSFDRNKFKKFYWKEVMGGNSDKFNELKKLLS